MNLYGRAVVPLCAICLVTGCSITQKNYQGKCHDSESKITSGPWELAKEVCFKDTTSRGISLGQEDPLDLISSQLWIESGSFERNGKYVSINYVQQAVFGKRDQFAPDLKRKVSAKVDCSTKEFLDSNGKYRSIYRWKQPVLAKTPRGEEEDYSSPLNPYSYIAEKYCTAI